MKSMLSLVLTLSLAVSAFPLVAQERPAFFLPPDTCGIPRAQPVAGPIRVAVMREAVRLAADQPSEPIVSSWSRVRELPAGTEITVTVRGRPAGRRSFIAADGSGLTVLNLGDPLIPSRARRLLSDLALDHPEFLLGAQTGGTFLLHDDVRLTPDGLFMAGRRVVDLGLVETIAGSDVAEITRFGTVNRGPAAGGAIAGALAGFLAGYHQAAGLANSPCHGSCVTTGWLVGLSLVGFPLAGGWLGYHAFAHKAEAVIYRAP
jgi:hypothetical protein